MTGGHAAEGEPVIEPEFDMGGWTDTLDSALQNISPIYKAYKTISDAKDAKEKAEKDKTAKEKADKDALKSAAEAHGGPATEAQKDALAAIRKNKGGIDVPWWVWVLGFYVLAKKL